VRAALCRRRAPAKGESDSGDSGGRGRDVLDADQSGLLPAADCMFLSGGSERRGRLADAGATKRRTHGFRSKGVHPPNVARLPRLGAALVTHQVAERVPS